MGSARKSIKEPASPPLKKRQKRSTGSILKHVCSSGNAHGSAVTADEAVLELSRLISARLEKDADVEYLQKPNGRICDEDIVKKRIRTAWDENARIVLFYRGCGLDIDRYPRLQHWKGQKNGKI